MSEKELIEYILIWSKYLIFPFTLCITSILLLKNMAVTIGLTDKPYGRKQHTGEIPLVGGIAVFVAFSTSLVILTTEIDYLPMLALCLLIVITGFLDDQRELSPWLRILVQVSAALGMVFFSNISIESIGVVYGDQPLMFATVPAIIFTVFCTVGVINAVNMSDGLDGLAGGVLIISFCGLFFLFWLNDDHSDAKIVLILSGGLLAFLCFNSRLFVPKARIFLGDAGSMFLGFMLCWFLIKGSQGSDSSFSPVAAGWIFGLPLLDVFSVVINRLANRESPFSPGRDHLHHLMQDQGISVIKTVGIIVLIHLFLVVGGIVLTFKPALELHFFWAFVILQIVYLLVLNLNRKPARA